MNNNYLIPANSKKSMQIFGIFNKYDLILFGSGLVVTLILLFIMDIDKLLYAILALSPALITGFLVLPIPNYHNMLTVILEAIRFITSRRNFIWKGWCFNHEEEQE